MSDNYPNNISNATGDKSVSEHSRKNRESFTKNILVQHISDYKFLDCPMDDDKRNNYFYRLKHNNPYAKKMTATIKPDVYVYTGEKMLPIRIEHMAQKSGNNAIERLSKVFGERWIEITEQIYGGKISDYLPKEYPLPVFGCFSGNRNAMNFLFKNFTDKQTRFFYYIDVAQEQERLINNLKIVADGMCQYCKDHKLL